MAEPRKLTEAERQAVDRLEKAFAEIPPTLALFFGRSGFDVFDAAIWNAAGEDVPEDMVSDSRDIRCLFDMRAP